MANGRARPKEEGGLRQFTAFSRPPIRSIRKDMKSSSLALLASSVLSLSAAALIFACSDSHEEVTATSCKEIDTACHDADQGIAAIAECHEFAESTSSTEEACAARKASCLAACTLVDPVVDGSTGGAVTLNFEARVGAEKFDCAKTFTGLGTTKATVSPTDFAFYVNNVRLVDTNDKEVPVALTPDGKFQTQAVALLDFADKTGSCTNATADVNSTVKGTIAMPSATYKGVRFEVGVPVAINHLDSVSQPSPLNISSMFWDWQGGYKFMRIDTRVNAADGGAPLSVLLHLGSTECTNPDAGSVTCAKPNRVTVSLDGAFNPSTNKIVLDYAKLVAGNDLTQNLGGAPGCMSGATDPECGTIFEKLGLDKTTGQASTTMKQSVFTIE